MAKLMISNIEVDFEGIDEEYLEKLNDYVKDVFEKIKSENNIVDTFVLMRLAAIYIANDYFSLIDKYSELGKKINEKYEEIEEILKRIK